MVCLICLHLAQEKLRASLESEVTKGNEPFHQLPQTGIKAEEITRRLRHKVL